MKSLRSKWHCAVVTVDAASRREAKLTQEQLAERNGWHRSKIARIESGERRLDVAEFINHRCAEDGASDSLIQSVELVIPESV